MQTLLNSLKQRLPSSWSIVASDSGTTSIHDPSVERGMGYCIQVYETINSYKADIEYGDFAIELFAYSEKQLANKEHPIRQIFDSNRNIKLNRHRRTIEDALNPAEVYPDGWRLEFEYRKHKGPMRNENSFSDLLLSILLFLLPYDIESEEEGAQSDSFSTKYERSHVNRSLCLAFHGYSCKVCGLNLEEQYGDIARQFIHVHHVNPVSKTGVTKPNPINDLVPLCPNCHGIAHLKNPPYGIEEIKSMIIKNNGKIFS